MTYSTVGSCGDCPNLTADEISLLEFDATLVLCSREFHSAAICRATGALLTSGAPRLRSAPANTSSYLSTTLAHWVPIKRPSTATIRLLPSVWNANHAISELRSPMLVAPTSRDGDSAEGESSRRGRGWFAFQTILPSFLTQTPAGGSIRFLRFYSIKESRARAVGSVIATSWVCFAERILLDRACVGRMTLSIFPPAMPIPQT